MFFKKKQKEDNIGSPSQWGAVLHKAVMFVTYPFRKPLYLLLLLVLILAAAYAVPVYYHKVKPLEVHTWYLEKIKNIDKGSLSQVSDRFSSFLNKIPALAEKPGKGTDRLVEVAPSAKEVRRQIFRAASGSKTQRVDVLAQEADNVVAVTAPAPLLPEETVQRTETTVLPNVNEHTDGKHSEVAERPVIVKKVSEAEGNVLRYLGTPLEISGPVKIHNANEMEVGGTYLFLYGVYSNPRNARGVKAAVFLKDALKGENIRCKIVAYTKDEVATGECFYEDISINNILVERGYSDRVALE